MTKKNKSLISILVVAVLAIVIALIAMRFIANYVMTDDSTLAILSTEEGSGIEFDGKFSIGGSSIALRSVTLIPKSAKYETLSAEINLDGEFVITGVLADIVYDLKMETTQGETYEGEVLFYTDSSRSGYTNLVDGIDFQVSGERNQIVTDLILNSKGKINCSNAY